MTLCALFVALIAAGAFIRIPTPLMEITLQLPIVLLAGILLGGKRAFFTVLVYILMGVIGLPVFSTGGGITYLLKPTFGYVLGFAAAAFITGTISSRKSKPDLKYLLISAFSGVSAVYFIGMMYYELICRFYLASPINLRALFVNGCLLTLPKDVAFCFLVSLLRKRLYPLISKL